MSRRSARIERTARARGTTPSASEAIATLAAALGCAKRVTGLNSRTRSHSRALSRSPARVAARTVCVCAVERCRPRGRCLHREVDAAPLRRDGGGRAAEPRRRSRQRRGRSRPRAVRRGGTARRPAAASAPRVVRHRSELGVEERRVEGVELLPRRACRPLRRLGRPRGPRRGRRRRGREALRLRPAFRSVAVPSRSSSSPRPTQAWSSMPRTPATCEICPAIAFARCWAWPPSRSACFGVNFLPAFSWA